MCERLKSPTDPEALQIGNLPSTMCKTFDAGVSTSVSGRSKLTFAASSLCTQRVKRHVTVANPLLSINSLLELIHWAH